MAPTNRKEHDARTRRRRQQLGGLARYLIGGAIAYRAREEEQAG
jgi:hypothetical protein